MLVQIASDLHIEFMNDEIEYNKLLKPIADILILAGDIGCLYKIEQLENFLDKISKKFVYIIYVPGNTEYYTYNNICPPENMEKLREKLKNIQKKIENLYILDRESIIIGNYLFSGCTLWSKLEKKLPQNYKISGLNTFQYLKNHERDLEFLLERSEYCQKNGLKHIIVTHHVPLILDKTKRKKDLYMTDLSKIIPNLKVDCWIFGHIHKNINFKLHINHREILFYSNQRGKPGSYCEDYKTDFVVKI